MKHLFLRFVPILALTACDGGGEAGRVSVPVAVDGSGIGESTSELGWTVTLTAARVAIADLELTVEGEAHASLLRTVGDWLVGTAWAHPGHQAGGEVTGELPGDFVLDFVGGAGAVLGEATALEGAYHGANFAFRRATAADGLAAGDPLLGHTAWLEGTATKGDVTVPFTAALDAPDGTRLVGAELEVTIGGGGAPTLRLALLTTDPEEGDSLFQKVDFGAAAPGTALDIRPGDSLHNVLQRTLVTHDHWRVTAEED